MKEDNVGKRLMDKLSFETKSAWDRLSKEQLKRVFAFADGYKMFLTQAKTEREANNYILTEAEKRGFVPADKVSGQLRPGTKLYFNNRGRSSVLVVLGQKPVTAGFRLVGSHIDAPRLDLKALPLYEDEVLVLLKTQ